ncbi:S24 family peptidase [Streptomyces mirabilis]|uniref:S24 family peptidase n=1 Tax=Streptomyces mirabilis TaxID=68239 RepID=UPI0036464EF0
MIDAAICYGGVGTVGQPDSADQGDLVAGLLEDKAKVKVLRRQDGQVWLMPRTPSCSPIPGDEAQILGKVLGALRLLCGSDPHRFLPAGGPRQQRPRRVPTSASVTSSYAVRRPSGKPGRAARPQRGPDGASEGTEPRSEGPRHRPGRDHRRADRVQGARTVPARRPARRDHALAQSAVVPRAGSTRRPATVPHARTTVYGTCS